MNRRSALQRLPPRSPSPPPPPTSPPRSLLKGTPGGTHRLAGTARADLLRLIQVAPVDVVSRATWTNACWPKPRTSFRNARSPAKPRTYSDYRALLAEKDLDIVLIGTPDHWHALPMIEACKAGMDIYCQKPTGVDVVKARPCLPPPANTDAWCRSAQRRSTPHLIEARERHIQSGKLGTIGTRQHLLLLAHADRDTLAQAPDTAPPDFPSITRCGPVLAPMRPLQDSSTPAAGIAFMEYCNGIVGDMCVHMLDMTRWMMDLGWPQRISSAGGIPWTRPPGPTSPTRRRSHSITAISRWSGRTGPGVGSRFQISVGATFTATGHL